MKRLPLNPIAVLCGLVLSMTAGAQQSTFAELINGTSQPSSLKLADLTDDYKAVRLRLAGESSPGIMGSLGSLMMMGSMSNGGRGGDAMMGSFFQLGALADLLWTKGQTISLAGHEFLVAYKLNTGLDIAGVGGPTPKFAANLTLDLVRTDNVISVEPDAAITPDKLRKTLTSAGVTQDVAPLRAQMSSQDAITSAILFPVFAQAKQAAKETVALSNAKQIALAGLMYSNDFDDQFPYVESTDQFKKVTMPYIKNNEVWKDDNPKGGGFRFAMNIAGVADTDIPSPAEAPMVYESNAWPDGRRVVAFVDGHAKRVSQDEWAAIEPRLKTKYRRTAKRPIKG